MAVEEGKKGKKKTSLSKRPIGTLRPNSRNLSQQKLKKLKKRFPKSEDNDIVHYGDNSGSIWTKIFVDHL